MLVPIKYKDKTVIRLVITNSDSRRSSHPSPPWNSFRSVQNFPKRERKQDTPYTATPFILHGEILLNGQPLLFMRGESKYRVVTSQLCHPYNATTLQQNTCILQKCFSPKEDCVEIFRLAWLLNSPVSGYHNAYVQVVHDESSVRRSLLPAKSEVLLVRVSALQRSCIICNYCLVRVTSDCRYCWSYERVPLVRVCLRVYELRLQYRGELTLGLKPPAMDRSTSTPL